jgi:hypothetical protein
MNTITNQHHCNVTKLDNTSINDPDLRAKLETIHRTRDLTLEKNYFSKEMRQFRRHADDIKKYPDWRLLLAITDSLGSVHYPQLFPYYLLDIYAPLFFERFPKGEIWFMDSDFSVPHLLDEDNRTLAELHHPRSDLPHGAQVYGLGFDGIMESIGLMLPLLLRYPHVQGRVTSSIGGFWYFITHKPISLHDVFQPDFGDFLMYDIRYVYSDSMTYPHGPARPAFEPVRPQEFRQYLDWYIKNIRNLDGFLQNIPDVETRMLTSFSIARICLDTYLIQLIEWPYIRKLLFLNLLDKYANLISELGTRGNEAQIWKDLLSASTFKKKLKKLTKKIPEPIGLGNFAQVLLTEMINDTLYTKYQGPVKPTKRHEEEALSYLRNYRNTNHGYLLDGPTRRTLLIDHSGDIPNYLPDLSYYFWHILIADPQALIDAFH